MALSKDVEQELLIDGYVRNIEKLCHIINIPKEINDIIYLFKQFCDEWSKKHSHTEFKINENNCILKIDNNKTMTAFGSHVVIDGVYKWKIKIVSCRFLDVYHIGLIQDSDMNMKIYSESEYWHKCGCMISTSGVLYGDWKQLPDFKCKWNKIGDILIIKLDLNDRTISFKLNGRDIGVAFRNITRSGYRLALTVSESKASCFKLL